MIKVDIRFLVALLTLIEILLDIITGKFEGDKRLKSEWIAVARRTRNQLINIVRDGNKIEANRELRKALAEKTDG